MKRQFILLATAMVVSISSLVAQDARQMASPEDRTKVTIAKFADFNLSTETRAKAEVIFTDYYKAQQAAMQEARSTDADRTTMMDKRKQLTTERDNKLKEILTEEQYAKWVSEIEPSLRPQRQNAAPKPAN